MLTRRKFLGFTLLAPLAVLFKFSSRLEDPDPDPYGLDREITRGAWNNRACAHPFCIEDLQKVYVKAKERNDRRRLL